MKRFLFLVALNVVALPLANGQSTNKTDVSKSQLAAQTNFGQEFKQLLQDRYDGKRRDDKEFIERTTAETRVFVNEKGDITRRTKAEVLAGLSKPPPVYEIPDEAKPKQSVEDVSVQLYGEVAVVQYRLDIRMVLNQEPVLKQFRRTEVFNRKAGMWQSVAGQETVIPGEIVVAKVDPKIYDDYVGRYQLFKGYIYTITRKGDVLMFNSRAVGDKELMPENETTFVEKGLLYRVIFVRNDKREITHLRLREFPGVEYNAIKIK